MSNKNSIISVKDKSSLKAAACVLKAGGILVFPTDTVYGIGCLINEEAIRKLYKIKNRPLDQPTALLISKNEAYHIYRTCAKCDMEGFLLGEVTLVMNTGKINIDAPEILIKDNRIGVRVPNSKWLQELIDMVGPIVTSSANKKSEPAPTKFEEISDEILKEVDLAIETSEELTGKPSTVYDIEDDKIIRA